MQSHVYFRRIAYIVGAFLIMAAASIIKSEEKPRKSEEKPRTLDTLIDLNFIGWKVRLPLGYIAGRPSPNEGTNISRGSGMTSFGFSFWMPDKRYALDDPFIGYTGDRGGPRPEEPGRNQSNLDEYLVSIVTVEKIDKAHAGEYVTPAKMLSNFQEVFDQDLVKQPDIYGLEKYSPRDPGRSYTYSVNGDDLYEFSSKEMQFFLSCPVHKEDYFYPECKGYVFYPEQNISCVMTFPAEGIKSWKDITSTTISLINSWIVK